MARKFVLGNDPFARGAALRAPARVAVGDERPAQPSVEPAKKGSRPAPAEKSGPQAVRARPSGGRVSRGERAAPAAVKPVLASKAPQGRRPPDPTQALASLPPAPPPVEHERSADVAMVSAEPAQPEPQLSPAGHSTVEQVARELLETTGAKLRHFLESRLPSLIEGLARSSADALGLTAMPVAVSDVDAFGMSADFVRRWQPVLARVLHDYFRTQVSGLEHLPPTGPAILVCNHSGVLPYDELLLAVALREGAPGDGVPGRELRPLSEDFAINAPFAGSWLNRFGLVRASQDNAERLLELGQLVAAFPEGSQGIGKLYRNRYQLQRFGRGGFVRLALRTQVPIHPVALVGGEESQPVLARVRLPKPLRPSHLPITPTFPLLGPLGLLPLPTRWSIQVGPAIHLPHAPSEAENRPLVAHLAGEIREQLQGMLKDLLARRTSVYF